MTGLPNNLISKLHDGIVSLSNVPTWRLLEWLSETDCHDIYDIIGCEVMYRLEDKPEAYKAPKKVKH